MKSFASRFPGKCKICNIAFPKGELIVWNRAVKGQVAHTACFTNNGDKFPGQDHAEPVQTETETVHNVTETVTDGPKSLEDIIADRVANRVKVNREEIVQTVLEVLETFDMGPKVQTIQIEDLKTGETKDMGLQHKLFPVLMKFIQGRDQNGNRLNIWITGPAGTGKTSAAIKCATALGMSYATMGSLMETYKLFGFMAPGTGQYVRTEFREKWEFGGVFVLDDFDGSDPVAAIELNNPLANGVCSFPDKVVPRHPDFVLILTANTWGHGGTEDYVGRLKQDKAFLDRFVKLDWTIDEALELATCPDTLWAKEVQRLRKNAASKGMKVLITPRASYYGAALLSAGIDRDMLPEYTVKPGMSKDQWSAIC